MQVDDKLAKEKLARILDDYAEKQNMAWVQPRQSIQICAQLIRNTDLTDCAPDQGSVRNATIPIEPSPEMLKVGAKMFYDCLNSAADFEHHAYHVYRAMVDAAIRALPDQKD